jgi:hypothetical protein
MFLIPPGSQEDLDTCVVLPRDPEQWRSLFALGMRLHG